MKLKGWQALILGVLFYSTSGLLVKPTTSPPIALAFCRLAVATAIVTPIWGPKAIRWWLKNFSWPVVFSSLGLALDFGLWFLSLRYTTVAHATFLVNMAPLWTAILGTFLLGETLSTLGWLGVLLGVAGGAVMSVELPVSLMNIGDLWALAASFGLSLYVVMARKGRQKASNDVFSYGIFMLTTLWIGVLALVFRQGFTIKPRDLPFALGLALGPQLGGNTMINYSLETLPASVVSVGLLGEPIIATVAAAFLFGEAITWRVVVGGLLIGLGIYFVTTRRGNSGLRGTERAEQ
ncbi:DMT family transporter [Coprothermobacteraceae bacterium]|nr:DMT family transporter [Coprothermobacteraceae bacterium]